MGLSKGMGIGMDMGPELGKGIGIGIADATYFLLMDPFCHGASDQVCPFPHLPNYPCAPHPIYSHRAPIQLCHPPPVNSNDQTLLLFSPSFLLYSNSFSRLRKQMRQKQKAKRSRVREAESAKHSDPGHFEKQTKIFHYPTCSGASE